MILNNFKKDVILSVKNLGISFKNGKEKKIVLEDINLDVRKGEIVSRDDLMEYLWNSDYYVDDNTLSVNVTRIRKKLQEVGIKDIIETRRGLGYIMP